MLANFLENVSVLVNPLCLCLDLLNFLMYHLNILAGHLSLQFKTYLLRLQDLIVCGKIVA